MALVFQPGFSTAAKVTNVSGRGVGMDVVKTNIERIGGAVSVDSTLGRGHGLAPHHPADAWRSSRR
jgi:two-component system chemotaxis sensor kinase CheA